jgi:BolA protein
MAEDLSALIAARLATLSPTVLEIDDDSAEHAGHAGAAAGGGHFSLLVVSGEFRSRSRVQRHQLVYERLRDLMPHRIHALSIRAFAPEEF